MKINIILISYNQSKYIVQALDSILMQETEHEVEIIIADDCSQDNTLTLIKERSLDSKFEFTYLANASNLGYVRNYQRAFSACNGNYVAVLEGDDFWTSPKHLMQHVTFLENHAEYSMSYNRHLRLWVEQDREEIFEWTGSEDYLSVTTNRLALENCIGNLSACMFRGHLINQLKPSLFDMEIADWMLGMVMGQYGPLAYLKEVTSAYRIHESGQWSRMTQEEQGKRIIELIEQYDAFLNYKYTKEFTHHKNRIKYNLYGTKTLRDRIKAITPQFLKKIYRSL